MSASEKAGIVGIENQFIYDAISAVEEVITTAIKLFDKVSITDSEFKKFTPLRSYLSGTRSGLSAFRQMIIIERDLNDYTQWYEAAKDTVDSLSKELKELRH